MRMSIAFFMLDLKSGKPDAKEGPKSFFILDLKSQTFDLKNP